MYTQNTWKLHTLKASQNLDSISSRAHLMYVRVRLDMTTSVNKHAKCFVLS